MKSKDFAELLQSAEEALAHSKGQLALKTTVLPDPPKPMSANEVRSVRKKMRASQAVFAHYLNVSPKLVQAWEAKRRAPQGPALLLLRVVEKAPHILLASIHKKAVRSRQRKREAS